MALVFTINRVLYCHKLLMCCLVCFSSSNIDKLSKWYLLLLFRFVVVVFVLFFVLTKAIEGTDSSKVCV